MAHFSQMKTGAWRAQIYRRGVRRSALFSSKADAETWALSVEKAILADWNGQGVAIKLDAKEFTELFARAKERARERGIDFAITRDDVVALYARCYGVCQVSGITFNRFRPENSTKRPWYPSLDRIDSSKPYVLNNCRFVCIAVNFGMGEWGEWVLKAVANAICYGRAGSLKQGNEAPPYKFEPIPEGTETYRQIVRRRQRRKIDPPVTHH